MGISTSIFGGFSAVRFAMVSSPHEKRKGITRIAKNVFISFVFFSLDKDIKN